MRPERSSSPQRTPHEAGIKISDSLPRENASARVCRGIRRRAKPSGTSHPCPASHHGKTSPVMHDNKTVFQGPPMTLLRVHSLIVEEENLPAELELVRGQLKRMGRARSWGYGIASIRLKECSSIRRAC
jgi:anthranilate/para-aminobenzoate synthase component II